ncbi:sugar ABC transporter substrate-binding protein [Micromonospora fulviviridis]|uniref:ABC transporter substrate-binding protein n=1 Tax=Micromonospora TaxID=1873 RepID=UPI00166519E2|nr:sugar ABC transporter substrate-binding protein [Micromonospora fulviviridis]GGR98522.1 sugar ABC transporter substrate-binding protein [Micromonospora fulviviridis]GHJ54319.1 sugar ABC transporter substrate-binding protein [Nonomuraea sp. TT08I-71]
MHRRLLIAPAIIAAAALLTACSNGNTGGDSNEKVTLTYGVWAGTQTPAMKEIAAAFTKENPNITVKVEERPWPEYWSTLQTGAAGGTAPDAFWMLAQNIRPYASGGQLLDVSDEIKKEKVDLSKYPKAVLDLYDQGDGKIYGLPKDVDTNAVWFNKAIFDKAGVAHPSANWTWDDFRATAKKLTDPAAGVWGVAAPIDYQGGYYNTIFQAGGQVISDDGKTAEIDSPKAQKGIEFWTNLQADKSSPTLKQLSDTEAETMFEQGKVAMYMSGAYWALKLYQNKQIAANVDVAPLPVGEKRATVTSGIVNVGFAGTKHPDAVKKFLLFASGKEAAEIQAKSGAVLPAYEGGEKAWMAAMPEFKNLQVFIDAKEYSVPLPVQGNAAEWQGDQTKYLTGAWEGTTSVADATKQYAGAIDKVLAEK